MRGPGHAALVLDWPRPQIRGVFQRPRFVSAYPSPYTRTWSYGAGETDQYVQQAASAYATYSAGTDPRIQAATLRAKIANYEKMRAKAPGMLRGLYDNELAKMRAKLAALEEKLAIQQEGESATRQWRGLGQAGVAVGVIGGVALVALIAAGVAHTVRK